MSNPGLLRVGVFKFASCDGCQLQILNLEEKLLDLAERVDFAHFLEVSSRIEPGPYDLAFVEGSITTERDAERIREIRKASRTLVTLGACATAGGIQALRNWADVEDWKRQVYPDPQWLRVLPRSTPIREHVRVDQEVHGCPPNENHLLQVLLDALRGTSAALPAYSVCAECKRAGNVCVLVARGVPCMGPVTRAGCGALCPSLGRDCYACFGPSEQPNPDALASRFQALGLPARDRVRRFRGVTGSSRAFRELTERLERDGDG